MDCHCCFRMQAFRHFFTACKIAGKCHTQLFNSRGEFWGMPSYDGTFHSLHCSPARGRRNRCSLSNILESPSTLARNNNNNNNCYEDARTLGLGRAWIHTRARRESWGDINNHCNDNDNDNDFVVQTRRKTSKSRTFWVCEECGDSYTQWWGTCHSCKQVNTLKRFTEASTSGGVGGGGPGSRAVEERTGGIRAFPAAKGWLQRGHSSCDTQPQRLSDVNKGRIEQQWRLPLPGVFGMEVARVLGGGLVPGSVVLIGGDPGVGKSTLLLQIAATLAEGCELNGAAPVLYISGEESVEQIGSRADRMRIDIHELFLYSNTDLEDILDKIQVLCPRAVIMDSIQTVYLREAPGSAGSVTQVKECATALLQCAKRTRIPIFLVGHVTKSGDIAGPRVLEHIVDVVLYMEGERFLSYRLLRAVKNRFGSTDEVGVFEMMKTGLHGVPNPSGLFLGERNVDSDILAGLAVAVTVDGSRPFLIEIQALCCSGVSIVRRFNGVQEKRAEMIIAAIFLNVVGGVRLREPAGDLAIAASICSSFLEIPIPADIAFIGEIGLGGELRMIGRMDKRINELARLGFTKCVIPKSAEKSINGLAWEGISVISCKNVKEVINTVFHNPKSSSQCNTQFCM